jgi:hypothetical protein
MFESVDSGVAKWNASTISFVSVFGISQAKQQEIPMNLKFQGNSS